MLKVKRAFVKYTKSGKLIPGSLIVTTQGGYPVDGLYREVITDLCCGGITTLTSEIRNASFPCTGYFQLEMGCKLGAHGDSNINVYVPGTFTSVSDIVTILNTYYSFIGSFSDAGSNQITVVFAGDYSMCKSAYFNIYMQCELIPE